MAYALAEILSLTSLSCIFLWSAVVSVPHVSPKRDLTELERNLGHVSAHISEFEPVAEPLALPPCGDIRLPEALLTPDPLLQKEDDGLQIRVSFIVGADGRVHSAFIMDSGGRQDDEAVLHTVSFWRYRPALCNGVPTDYEALVRFTVR